MPSIAEGTGPGSISVSSLGLICCNLSKYLGNLVLSRDFEWEAAGPAPTQRFRRVLGEIFFLFLFFPFFK